MCIIMIEFRHQTLEELALQNTFEALETGTELLEIRYREISQEAYILGLDTIHAIKSVLDK